MKNTPTIAELHKRAYAVFPRDRVHDILHDWAVQQFHRGSLTECTAAERQQLAQQLATRPRRDPHRDPHRDQGSGARGEQSPERKRRVAPHTTRPRGKVHAEGTVQIATPKQRAYAAVLLHEVFGSHPEPLKTAHVFTRGVCGAMLSAADSEPVDYAAIAARLTTDRAATALINVLIGRLKKSGQWGRRRGEGSGVRGEG